jgi:NAD(P)H-dependent FMN reductase
MLKIGIIVGSTRPGRKAAAVAKWVHDILKSRKDAEFEIVDIEDYKLPLLDEPVSPRMHQYSKPHTKTWNNKAAGFVGYGGAGGVRAVENLRLVMGEIKIADVRAQVALSLFTDFENFTTFKPHEQHDKAVHLMADEVIAWGGALKALRGLPER